MSYMKSGDGSLFTFSFQSFKRFKKDLKKEYEIKTGNSFNSIFPDKQIRAKIFEKLLHVENSNILSLNKNLDKIGFETINNNIDFLNELTLEILGTTKFNINKIIDYQ